MELSERQIATLFSFFKEANLTELDMSWIPISVHMLPALFQALESNVTLQSLNLGWLRMGGPGGRDAVIEKSFPKFCKFIKENARLTHLNLTSIGLSEKMMHELICNLKRSQSLHCVHLCGNALSEQSIDLLNLKLKPTLVSGLAAPEKIRRREDLLLRI